MYQCIHCDALNAMKLERFHVQLSIWHCCFWMNRTERVPLLKSWFHLRFAHAYPNQPGSTFVSLIISDTLLNIWCTKSIQNPDPFYLPMDWLLRNLDWGWMLCRCEVIHSMFLVVQLPSNQCCSLGLGSRSNNTIKINQTTYSHPWAWTSIVYLLLTLATQCWLGLA